MAHDAIHSDEHLAGGPDPITGLSASQLDASAQNMFPAGDGVTTEAAYGLYEQNFQAGEATAHETLQAAWPKSSPFNATAAGGVSNGEVVTAANGYCLITSSDGTFGQDVTLYIAASGALTDLGWGPANIGVFVEQVGDWYVYSIAATAAQVIANLELQAAAAEETTLRFLTLGETLYKGTVVSVKDGGVSTAKLDSTLQERTSTVFMARAVATSNLTLSGEQTVDGVALVTGDVCLPTGQTTTLENGPYTVAAGAWARLADWEAGDSVSGKSVTIKEGTVGASSIYICNNAKGSDVVGTDSLTFHKNLDDWQIQNIGGSDTLVPKNGENAAIGTEATVYSATGDDVTGNFTNAGVNVEYDTDHWINILNYGTRIAGSAWSVSSGWTVDGPSGSLIDDALSTGYYVTPDGIKWAQIDLGSSQEFNTISLGDNTQTGNQTPASWKVYGSDNATTGHVLLGSQSAPTVNGTYNEKQTLSQSYTYRYVRIIPDSGIGIALGEIAVFNAAYSSTSNSFDTETLDTGSVTYALSSVICRNENGDAISGTGKVNLAYYNGTSWSSLVDLETFKALSPVTNANFALRIQLVDDQKLQSIEISTPQSRIIIDKNGDVVREVNAVELDRLTEKHDRIRAIQTVAAATADIEATADIVHVNYTTTGAVTSLTLLTAQVVAGRMVWIKDEDGNAGTNNITIDTEGAETIDGAATLVISTDYGTVGLYCDGTNWLKVQDSQVSTQNKLDFNTAGGQSYLAGRLSYDAVRKTVQAASGFTGVVNQIGQENWIPFFNDTGVQIDDGKVVNATGVDATNSLVKGILADADSPATSSSIIGLATHDVPDGTWGLATKLGEVRDIDTSGLATGGVVYASGTPGGMTNTRPVYPGNIVIIGTCIKSHATEGIMLVDVTRFNRTSAFRSYTFSSQGVGAGTYYRGGFYDFPATDANLTQASASITHGTANATYAAHAGIVPSGAGTVDTGQVGLRVTGTEDSETGTQTAAQTGIITDDITTLTADTYFETTEKFSGTVTFELYVVSGTPTTYSLDFNYGFAKYEDVNNQDYTVTGFECVWYGGANDSSADIELLHHKATGWTYAATGFVPGNGAICQKSVDQATAGNIANGEEGAYKRVSLDTFIDGNGSEGIMVRVTTGAANTFQSLDIHISGKSEELT